MPDEAPAASPEGWQQLCRDVPALREQVEELAHDQHQIALRTVRMDDRNKAMASNVAELAQRYERMQGQIGTLAGQMQQVLDAMRAIGNTPSGFVGLARDVGGTVRMTKRLGRWALGVATGAVALYGAFHLGEKKTEPVKAPAQQAAPKGEE